MSYLLVECEKAQQVLDEVDVKMYYINSVYSYQQFKRLIYVLKVEGF